MEWLSRAIPGCDYWFIFYLFVLCKTSELELPVENVRSGNFNDVFSFEISAAAAPMRGNRMSPDVILSNFISDSYTF
jgi:hypothetical protein